MDKMCVNCSFCGEKCKNPKSMMYDRDCKTVITCGQWREGLKKPDKLNEDTKQAS